MEMKMTLSFVWVHTYAHNPPPPSKFNVNLKGFFLYQKMCVHHVEKIARSLSTNLG